jgi:hypothetical protein
MARLWRREAPPRRRREITRHEPS